MFEAFRNWRRLRNKGGRIVEVGWLVDTDKAGFIYDAPVPFDRNDGKTKWLKAVPNCPAVLDFEARFFVVPCPVDIDIRLGTDNAGKPVLINNAGPNPTIYGNKLGEMLHLIDARQWRRPDRPVIQVSAPYRFLADETVYMNQLPPLFHYRDPPLPGVTIGGRFPIDVWPRIMLWAFEWHDTSKPLSLKRGEPWFALYFEAQDPTRKIRLVPAQMTPELKEYCVGLDSVTNYVSRTFSLFEVARARRPKRLLVKREGEK